MTGEPVGGRRRALLIAIVVFGSLMLVHIHNELHGWGDWVSVVIMYLIVVSVVVGLMKILGRIVSVLFHRR
jgi:hypothetical protein